MPRKVIKKIKKIIIHFEGDEEVINYDENEKPTETKHQIKKRIHRIIGKMKTKRAAKPAQKIDDKNVDHLNNKISEVNDHQNNNNLPLTQEKSFGNLEFSIFDQIANDNFDSNDDFDEMLDDIF